MNRISAAAWAAAQLRHAPGALLQAVQTDVDPRFVEQFRHCRQELIDAVVIGSIIHDHEFDPRVRRACTGDRLNGLAEPIVLVSHWNQDADVRARRHGQGLAPRIDAMAVMAVMAACAVVATVETIPTTAVPQQSLPQPYACT